MNRLEANRSAWVFMLIVGMVLVSVALFLHPMSPEDFMSLALSDPLQSVLDAQGGNMAIFFWISVGLATSGLFCLLISSHSFHRLLHPPKSNLRALRH
jgi:hypothetical protein